MLIWGLISQIYSVPLFQQQVVNGVIQLTATPGYFPGGPQFENLADFFSSLTPGSVVALCRGDIFRADPSDWSSMPTITLTSCVCDPTKSDLKPVVVGAWSLTNPTSMTLNGVSVWRFPLTFLPKGSISAVWVDNTRYTLARFPNGDALLPSADIVSSSSFRPPSTLKNLGGWIGSSIHVRTANDTFSQAMVRSYSNGIYTLDEPILKPKERTVTVLIASDEFYRVSIGGKITSGFMLSTTNITTVVSGDASFVAIEGLNTAGTNAGLWAAVYVDGVAVTSTGVSTSKFLISGTTQSNASWLTDTYWSPDGTWTVARTSCSLNWGYTMNSPGLSTNPVWSNCQTPPTSSFLRVNLNFSTNPTGFFFDNVQSELDTVGEYYADANFLYVAPLAGVTYKSPSTTDSGVWVTVDPALNTPALNVPSSPSLSPSVTLLDSGELKENVEGGPIGSWNGYIQANVSQRPLYFCGGGFNNQPFVRFIKSSADFLNGGPETLNINTNGGLTMMAALKFSGLGSSDRVIDFGNPPENLQAGLFYQTYSFTGLIANFDALTAVSTGVQTTDINHNWSGGTILNSGLADNVAVRYSGFLYIGTSATYNFRTQADNGVILRIGGVTLIQRWNQNPPYPSVLTSSIYLTAGTYVPIELWYYEANGGASLLFEYNTGGSFVTVPASMFFYNPNGFNNLQMVRASGPGLIYKTYTATTWTNNIPDINPSGLQLLTTGIVSSMDWSWGTSQVLDSNRVDTTIINFNGFFKVETTATYNFGINSDDGCRLIINGVTVIDSWIIQDGLTMRTGSIALTAGTFVTIDIWYFESTTTSFFKLQYNTGGAYQVVPLSSLYYGINDIGCNFFNGNQFDSLSASNVITNNQWANFACRYTASTRLTEILKNGVVVASKTLNFALTDRTVSTSNIGKDIATGTNYFDGDMGGLRVYDRALSNDDINAVFNAWNFTASDHEVIPFYLSSSVLSFDSSILTAIGIRFDKMLQGLYLQRNYVSLTDCDFTNIQQSALLVVDSVVSLNGLTVDQVDTHGILIESSPASITSTTIKNVGLLPLTLSSNHYSPIIKGLYASVGLYATTVQSFSLTSSTISNVGASTLYISGPAVGKLVGNTFDRANLETMSVPYTIKGDSMVITNNIFQNYYPTASNLTGSFYDSFLGMVLEGTNNTFMFNLVNPGSLNASYLSLNTPSTSFSSNRLFNTWMTVVNSSATYALTVYNNTFFSLPFTDGVNQFIRPDTSFPSVFSVLSANSFCNNFGTVTAVLNSDVSITGNTLKGDNDCYTFTVYCPGPVIVGVTTSITCSLSISSFLTSANMYLSVSPTMDGAFSSNPTLIPNTVSFTVPLLSGGYSYSLNSTVAGINYYNILYSATSKLMAENKLYVILQEPTTGISTVSSGITILDPTFTITATDNQFNPFTSTSISLSILTGFVGAQIDLYVSNSSSIQDAMLGSCLQTVSGGTVSFNLTACYTFTYGSSSWQVTGNGVTKPLLNNRFYIYGKLGNLGGVTSINSIGLVQPTFILTSTPVNWVASMAYTVTWTPIGIPVGTLTSVNLMLGSSLLYQVNTTSQSGSASLLLPSTLSSSTLYYIQINSTISNIQSSYFSIVRGVITLTTVPVGWLAGGKYNVSWTSTNLLSNVGAILSLYNGPSVVTTVLTMVGSSPVELQVPGWVSPGSTYYLSISNLELSSQTNPFFINEGTFTLVTVPVGWLIGNAYTISWSSVNISSEYPVTVNLLTGSTPVVSITSTSGANSVSMALPGTLDTGLSYTLQLTNDIHSISSGAFTLSKGSFGVASGIRALTLGASPLSLPENLITSPENDLLIMNVGNCIIGNYSFANNQVSTISPPGCVKNSTSLSTAMGICHNADKSIYYVVERDGGRLLQFNIRTGTFAQLYDAASLLTTCAVSSRGDVYFACFGQHLVYVYNITTSATRVFAGVLNTAATATDDCSRLNRPWGVEINDQDNVIVSTHLGYRVCMYYPDGRYKQIAGTVFGSVNGNALSQAQLKRPVGIDFDRSGNIYISDKDVHNLRLLKASNNEVITVYGTGSPGTSITQLNNPHGVLSDGLDGLYIADRNNHRIQLIYNMCPPNTYLSSGSCVSCSTGSFSAPGAYDCSTTWIASQSYRFSWTVNNINVSFPTTVSLMLNNAIMASVNTVAGGSTVIFPLPGTLISSLDYYFRISNSIASFDTSKFQIKKGQLILTNNQFGWMAGYPQRVTWKSKNLISYLPMDISLLQTSSPNLVVNGDFEHFSNTRCTSNVCRLTDTTVIFPWVLLQATSYELQRYDAGVPYSGNFSIDMNNSGPAAFGQTIGVKPGSSYRTIYHIRCQGVNNRTGYIQITNGEAVVARQDFYCLASYHGQNWIEKVMKFTAPKTTSSIRLELWSTSVNPQNDGPLIDGIEMYEVVALTSSTAGAGQIDFTPPAASVRGNVLWNASFENLNPTICAGVDNCVVAGSNIPPWTLVDSTNVKVVMGLNYGLTQGKIALDLNAAGPYGIQQSMQVLPGQTYMLTYFVHRNINSPSDTKTGLVTIVLDGVTIASQSISLTSTNTGWMKQTLPFNISPTLLGMKTVFVQIKSTTAGTAGPLVNDISVEQTVVRTNTVTVSGVVYSATDYFPQRNEFRLLLESDEISTISPPFTIQKGSMQLLSAPSVWYVGLSYNVSWSITNILGSTPTRVSIYNGLLEIYSVNTTADAGTISFTVPTTLPSHANYTIAVINDIDTVMSNTFQVNRGWMTLTSSPSSWIAGSIYTVNWTTSFFPNNVMTNLMLYRGAVLVGTTVVNADLGFAQYTVPGAAVTSSDYKLVLSNDISTVESGVFSITRGWFDFFSGGIKTMTVTSGLSSPEQILLTNDNSLLITNVGDCTIRNYSFVTNQLTIASPSGCAKTTTSLSTPMGLCANADRSIIYVTENTGRRLVRFNPYSRTFDVLYDGGFWISSCRVSSKGDIFFAGFTTHAVYVYNITTNAVRVFAGTSGVAASSGSDCSLMNSPWALEMDDKDNVYVAQYGLYRICMYYPDGTFIPIAGTTQGLLNGNALTTSQLKTPLGMEFDRSGNLFFAERENHNIRMINAANNEVITVLGDGTSGSTMTKLNWPHGILSDGYDGIYVADRNNNRIQLLYNTCPVNTYFKGACLSCPVGSTTPPGSYDCSNTWIASQTYRFTWDFMTMNASTPTSVRLVSGTTTLASIDTMAGGAGVFIQVPSRLSTGSNYYISVNNSIASINTPVFTILRGKILLTNHPLSWLPAIAYNVTWSTINLNSTEPALVGLYNNGVLVTSVNTTAGAGVASLFVPELVPTSSLYTIRIFINEISVVSPQFTINRSLGSIAIPTVPSGWLSGDSYSVAWTISTMSSIVNTTVTLFSGTTSIMSVVTLSGTGTISWTLSPTLNTGSYFINIKNSLGEVNSTAFTITRGTLSISTIPNNWIASLPYLVEWQATNMNQSYPSTLQLLKGGVVQTSLSTLSGANSLTLTLPSSLLTDTDYSLRIFNAINTFTSPTFLISRGGISITSNTVLWLPGGAHVVTWTSVNLASGSLATVALYQGSSIITAVNTTIDAGTATLRLPETIVSASNYYVNVSSLGISWSTLPFSIDVTLARINILTTPTGWVSGSTYPVSWTITNMSSLVITNVSLFLQNSQVSLVRTLAGTGVVSLTIPPTAVTSSLYYLRVSSRVGSTNSSTFTIQRGSLISTDVLTTWIASRTYLFSWSASNIQSDYPTTVNLLKASQVILSLPTTASAGSINITIPSTTDSGSNYYIQVVNDIASFTTTNFTISRTVISISTVPSGWIPGSSYTVQWTYINFPTDASATIGLYNGAMLISSTVTTMGAQTASVSVPAVIATSNAYTVKISCNGFIETTSAFTISSSSGSITISTVPSGWVSGSTYTVQWSFSNITPTLPANVTLYSNVFVVSRVTTVINAGTVQITIPPTAVTASDYYISIVTSAGLQATSAFTVTQGTFSFTSPTLLFASNSLSFTWSALNMNASYPTRVSFIKGSTVILQQDTTAGANGFTFTIPSDSVTGSDYYLRLSNDITTATSNNFTVLRGRLSIADQTEWIVGNTFTVSFTSTNMFNPNTADVSLVNNLGVVILTASPLVQSGSASFVIPITFTDGTFSLRISCLGVTNTSSTFPIYRGSLTPMAAPSEWLSGSTYTITWTSSRLPANLPLSLVLLSNTNSVVTLVNTTINSGTIQMTVPSQTPSGSYTIQFLNSIDTESTSPFTITRGSFVVNSLTSNPIASTPFQVTWSALKMRTNIATNVSLMQNGTVVLTTSALSAANVTSLFTLPSSLLSGNYYIQIANEINSIDFAPFYITRGTFSIMSGPTVCYIGGSCSISWSNVNLNSQAQVIMQLYRGPLLVLNDTTTMSASSLIFNIPIDTIPDTNYRLQIISDEFSFYSPLFSIQRGTITINTNPTGWLSGSTYQVSWTLTNIPSFYVVTVGLYDRTTGLVFLNTTAGMTFIDLPIPPTADTASTYNIKVWNSINSQVLAGITITRGTFTINTAPSDWIASSTYLFSWTAFNMNPSYPTTITLLNNLTTVSTLATTASAGSVNITLPSSLSTGSLYKIRISNDVDFRETPTFTILRGALSLTSSTVGWTPGFPQFVNWTSINLVLGAPVTVSILFGSTVIQSSVSTVGARSQLMMIPSTATSPSPYTIRLSTGSADTEISTTSVPFSISRGSINITTTPSGWLSGYTYPFRWTIQSIPVNTPTLVNLYRDTTLITQVSTLSQVGNVNITVPPTTPTGSYFIQVMNDYGTQISSNFPITRGNLTLSTLPTTWIATLSYQVTWSFMNMDASVPSKLLLLNNSDTLIEMNTTVGTGSLVMTLPSNITTATSYKLRIENIINSVESQPFEIKQGLLIVDNITMVWVTGRNYNITWNTLNIPANQPLGIHLYQGATKLTTLPMTTAGLKRAQFSVPTTYTPNSNYQLVLETAIATNTSNTFTVGSASITLGYTPSSMIASQTYNVTWSSANLAADAQVTIAIVKGGSTQLNSTTVPATDGKAIITVPSTTVTGTDFTIKLISGSFNQESLPFTIYAGALSVDAPVCPDSNSCTVSWSNINLDGTSTATITLLKSGIIISSLRSQLDASSITFPIWANVTTGTDYQFEVAVSSFSSRSPKFAINKPLPSLTLTCGEMIKTSITCNYQVTSSTDNIKVYLGSSNKKVNSTKLTRVYKGGSFTIDYTQFYTLVSTDNGYALRGDQTVLVGKTLYVYAETVDGKLGAFSNPITIPDPPKSSTSAAPVAAVTSASPTPNANTEKSTAASNSIDTPQIIMIAAGAFVFLVGGAYMINTRYSRRKYRVKPDAKKPKTMEVPVQQPGPEVVPDDFMMQSAGDASGADADNLSILFVNE